MKRDSSAPRVRRRTLRRWFFPAVAALVLGGALTAVVQRGEEGRQLSRELLELQNQEEIARDRIAETTARVDSLGSLGRLEMAAGALGLRQPEEGEVVYLQDVPASSVPGVGSRED